MPLTLMDDVRRTGDGAYLGAALKPHKDGSKERACSRCGVKELIRKDNTSTCCRRCSAEANGRLGHAARRKKRIVRACGGCHTRIETNRSSNRKFCSVACRSSAAREQRQCWHCEKTFNVLRSAVSGKTNASGHFCSRPCYDAWLCKPDRVSGRGSRWHHVRQEVIRTCPFCAWCGTRRSIQIHHIVPFRLTHDNSPRNLIPLCVTCHKRIEWATVVLEMGGFAPEALFHVMSGYLRHRQRQTLHVLIKLRRTLHPGTLAHRPTDCLCEEPPQERSCSGPHGGGDR